MILFSPDPDWETGIKERTEYLTQIITTYGGAEQRYSLRKTPRPRLRFNILTLSAYDSATLEALLIGWQSQRFGVPFWPDAQVLSAPLGIGATTVPVVTQYTKFAAGITLALWRDMHTYETQPISAITSSNVTLSTPTAKAWAADGLTFVVPVLNGRLQAQQLVTHETSGIMSGEVDFACEVV